MKHRTQASTQTPLHAAVASANMTAAQPLLRSILLALLLLIALMQLASAAQEANESSEEAHSHSPATAAIAAASCCQPLPHADEGEFLYDRCGAEFEAKDDGAYAVELDLGCGSSVARRLQRLGLSLQQEQ